MNEQNVVQTLQTVDQRQCCYGADNNAVAVHSYSAAGADGGGALADYCYRCYQLGCADWVFQEVRRSSVKARCSGKQVLADEGDAAQRQRSGPGLYFARLLSNVLKQLQVDEKRL